MTPVWRFNAKNTNLHNGDAMVSLFFTVIRLFGDDYESERLTHSPFIPFMLNFLVDTRNVKNGVINNHS